MRSCKKSNSLYLWAMEQLVLDMRWTRSRDILLISRNQQLLEAQNAHTWCVHNFYTRLSRKSMGSSWKMRLGGICSTSIKNFINNFKENYYFNSVRKFALLFKAKSTKTSKDSIRELTTSKWLEWLTLKLIISKD
jgi:hypothetical protein